MGIIRAVGNLAVTVIDVFVLFKNIKKRPEDLRHTFVVLQLVFGAIMLLTGNGLGELLWRLLIALLAYMAPSGLVKVLWIISAAGGLISLVSGGVSAIFGGISALKGG